jgi:hypothetical protein
MVKRLIYTAILLLLASAAFAQTYNLDWYVIGSGGGSSADGTYRLDGTLGQPVIGEMLSANYNLHAGFWVPEEGAPGCVYVIGDANNSGLWTGQDVTYSVRFFKGGPVPPYSCECTPGHTWYVSGDVNGSCSFTGQDVTYMVRHFKSGVPAIVCADCPPGGMLAPPVPGPEPNPAVQSPLSPRIKAKPKAVSKG